MVFMVLSQTSEKIEKRVLKGILPHWLNDLLFFWLVFPSKDDESKKFRDFFYVWETD